MARSKQLTIRGVAPELARKLESVSRERGTSVNAVVLAILQEALGIEARREWLRRFGTWTDDEFDEFQAILNEMREVDERDWQ